MKYVAKTLLQALLICVIVLLVFGGQGDWAIFFAVLLVLSCL